MLKPLDHIIQQKKRDIIELKQQRASKSFKRALTGNTLAFIGEIKRASPSKGHLASIPEPSVLLQHYLDGGVAALSVLTEATYFLGSLDDLTSIAHELKHASIPVLRKDFILDKAQLFESVRAGADAVLLITSILKEKTSELYEHATRLGLESMVEVHTQDELLYALSFDADIILVNNRNLHDLSEDINTCLTLAPLIPKHVLSIAASAIKTKADIQNIKHAGFDAVLMGETLVTSANPTKTLQSLQEAL
jgi:indole-3-glycerol phosphate synthase